MDNRCKQISYGNNHVKAEFKLANGRTFMTEQIKCPICAAKMEMAQMTTLPRNELRLRDCTPPSCATVCESVNTYCESVNTYESVMQCPNRCCTLKFEHEVTQVVVGN